MLANPVRSPQRRLVRADVADRHVQFRSDLLYQGRLAYLPWPRHDLDGPARLDEPLGEEEALGALEVSLLFTHDTEYFYSVL